nr:hypothetical protein BaRGS_018505 [Batillaria attramentaria]
MTDIVSLPLYEELENAGTINRGAEALPPPPPYCDIDIAIDKDAPGSSHYSPSLPPSYTQTMLSDEASSDGCYDAKLIADAAPTVVWFQEWYVAHHDIFQTSEYDYLCANLNTTSLGSFYLDDQACDSDLVIQRRECRQQCRPSGDYDYDLFVCFASEDKEWVLGHLKPELEDRLGLRLCLHHRDFNPGRTTVDNIDRCIDASKRVMMVFSSSFARSSWCQHELEVSRNQVIEENDSLLVVLRHSVA